MALRWICSQFEKFLRILCKKVCDRKVCLKTTGMNILPIWDGHVKEKHAKWDWWKVGKYNVDGLSMIFTSIMLKNYPIQSENTKLRHLKTRSRWDIHAFTKTRLSRTSQKFSHTNISWCTVLNNFIVGCM